MALQVSILAKATGAGNTSDFEVSREPVTVAIYPEANIGTDTAILHKKNPDGTYDSVYKDGAEVELSASEPAVVIYGGGVYRLEFTGRTAAIGAYIESTTPVA